MNFSSPLSLKDRHLLLTAAFAGSIACSCGPLMGILSSFPSYYVLKRYKSDWGFGKLLLSGFIGGFLIGALEGGIVALYDLIFYGV